MASSCSSPNPADLASLVGPESKDGLAVESEFQGVREENSTFAFAAYLFASDERSL